MQNHITEIEEIWQIRDSLNQDSPNFISSKKIVDEVISELEDGRISVCEKIQDEWKINEWIKKAILLNFRTSEMRIYDGSSMRWYDKIDPKYSENDDKKLKESGVRMVPGAFVRKGSYLASNVVVMPSFINIGAYVGSGTLVDTWATIGSCAYVGKNCHISGGAGIGGVLEPLQAKPVIVEDNCFIGARSEIVEGVLVEEGAVISMGVFIGSSTKIVDRHTGEISYGKIPAYSVVVPGVLPADKPGLPGLSCAVIIKKVDQKTRAKTSINELLRD
ncbi:MAG: 2,3,4,5-tetrahydropyridine-2,6-dicarboxylate N-succinyltransferase [Pseudomonadota bacterium]